MASPVFKSEVAGLNSVIMKILMEIVEREMAFPGTVAWCKVLSSQIRYVLVPRGA